MKSISEGKTMKSTVEISNVVCLIFSKYHFVSYMEERLMRQRENEMDPEIVQTRHEDLFCD